MIKVSTTLFCICLLYSLSAQNLGVNAANPRTSLEVNGNIIASDQNLIIGQQSDSPLPEFFMGGAIVVQDSSGIVYDDGGPDSDYGPNQLSSLSISPVNAKYLRLTITRFISEATHDSLNIIDDLSNEIIATLKGVRSGVYITCNNVRLEFATDGVNQLDGFIIQWDAMYEDPENPYVDGHGAGGRFEYIAHKNALRSGMVEGNHWDGNLVGNNSLAAGKNTIAKGSQSTALGYETQALNDHSLVVGRYNDPQPNSLFEVGNGTGDAARSNAFVVYKDGAQQYNGPLNISTNSSLSTPHINMHEEGNDYARLKFDNENGDNYWTIAAYIANNNKNDRLNFWNGTSGDVMTITGDGEVGIGVGISPKVPFHIGYGRRVLFGTDTLGNGDKLMFLPDLHAFRVGTVATGAASTYWNRDSIGLYSFASGLNTRAQGFGATAMGRDTEATNSYAFASGFFTNADGQYSTAMGFNTDAFALGSTALGYSTDATRNYTFAAGYFAKAEAIYSVAIGHAVEAQSYSSMAVGRYNVGGGNAEDWVATDPIFEVGIGDAPSNKINAMTVYKNGRVKMNEGPLQVGSQEEFTDAGNNLLQLNASFIPESDDNRDLGKSGSRWRTVYAANGTINTSDARLKKNIAPVKYGLDELMKLNPVSYEWRRGSETKLGLIAQEVLNVIPEVVSTHEWEKDEQTGHVNRVEAEAMGMYYSDLIPVLIKSIQEQQVLIEDLQKEIQLLKEK